MSEVYNTQQDIANNFKLLFKETVPGIRKTQLNILPHIIFGMIQAESVVALDIAKNLKGPFSMVHLDSVKRRIKRFFTNKLFDPYYFYEQIIGQVVSNYKKKHNDKRVHIAFDHMYSSDNYTVFMISMRIGNAGIPLWFRCFKGKNNTDAYKEELITEGIKTVSSMFDNRFELIFMGDRWFNSVSLLNFIASLGHTYVVRAKKDFKVLVYDKKEGHEISKTLGDLPAYEYHANHFLNVPITDDKFYTNVVLSKKHGVDEHWIILTNGDYKRAIKDYGYRFGSIETLFKQQKSNGFNIKKTVNASVEYFATQYMCVCFGCLYLTILGADYSKNTKCYENVKIKTHNIINNVKVRCMSLFNTGLTLFNRAFNSSIYVRLPFRLVLYDI